MLSVFDHGPPPKCPVPFNMAAHVLKHASRFRDKVALSVLHPNHSDDWTFGQIASAVQGIAAGFLQQGLQAGDRILLRLDNTPETPLSYLAAIAVDLVPVPTSSQLTETETARIIHQLNPALILHADGVACPSHPNRIPLSTVRDMMILSPASFTLGDPERPAYIVYTSGTSGAPRAVEHAHRAIWARQMMLADWYDLHEDDRMMHAGAFNWTYTMGTGLMDPWSVGATALIPAPGTNPADLPLLMHHHKATIFAAAPGVYRKFLNDDSRINTPYLRHGLSAGEKLSNTIRHAWVRATNTDVHEAYGMSECSTFLSASPAHPARDKAIGRPQTGRRIAILDNAGRPVPRKSPGMIALHRSDPGLMLKYVGAPEETARRFQGDWFITGDQGILQQDDQILFLGRDDDMMNAGGYRVSPLEVEAALAAAPGVTAIAVTEVEVKTDVRIIVAFYTAPAPLDSGFLDAYARERLAPYKCPREFIHLNQLPVGPNGKLARKSLKSYGRPS